MPDTKISDLTSGGTAQSTDQIPVVRSGANLRVSAGSIVAGEAASRTSADTALGALIAAEVSRAVAAEAAIGGGGGGGGSPMGKPAYFFPTVNVLTPNDQGNVDPRGGVGLALCPSWLMFYLPFAITITRYSFQVDSAGGGFTFYAGMYDQTGALIFDIGAVSVATTGTHGPGAATDPGTGFFNASRSPIGSVTLNPGWYLYGWGASDASGTPTFPGMFAVEALLNETVMADTGSLPAGIVRRWGHDSDFTITGGHMPLTLGRSSGGTTSQPPNICFLA
jgi:hypothetical protein